MAEFKSIPVAEIVVPERIRPVDEDHAKTIAASIASKGLLNPITVRHTPKAKGGKYTLVAEAHRLRAIEINGAEAIDVVLVKTDKDSALLLEVAENLFRNELSVIDRSVFVQTYRELWQKQNGEIKAGRPENSANFAQLTGKFSPANDGGIKSGGAKAQPSE